MDNADIHRKLQMIIEKDGYSISMEFILQIEENCNKIKSTKLALVGICYHCCVDEEKNITKVPSPSFGLEQHRYRHRCMNCTRSIYNGKCCDICSGVAVRPCGFYISRKQETFTEYVDRVYQEYFVGENVEKNQEDTNDKHIMDVGEIFFTNETKIDTKERQDIFGTLILSDWYSTLINKYRIKIRTLEKYLYLKYRQNKQIYCFHLSHVFWEFRLISICDAFFKGQTEYDDIDMANEDDSDQQAIKKQLSELLLNKKENIQDVYNSLKDILKVDDIDTSLSDEEYEAIQVKKFRSNSLLTNII
eukprot:514184_1